MMVLNISTGQVSSVSLKNVICVRDGKVLWGEKDTSTNVMTYYRGTLNDHQVYLAPKSDMCIDSRFDCGWVQQMTFGMIPTKIPYKAKLLDENYLEIIKSQPDPTEMPQELTGKNSLASGSIQSKIARGGPQQYEINYYANFDSLAIYMPFRLGGWNGYGIKYIKWRDAYLVRPDQYYVDKIMHVWWVERSGVVHEETIPDKVPFPFSGGIDFHPVREGLFISYNGGSLSGDSGGYLLRDGKIERLTEQIAHKVSISPDGCTVAFVDAKKASDYFSKEKPFRTLKTINFCEGRKHQ